MVLALAFVDYAQQVGDVWRAAGTVALWTGGMALVVLGGFMLFVLLIVGGTSLWRRVFRRRRT